MVHRAITHANQIPPSLAAKRISPLRAAAYGNDAYQSRRPVSAPPLAIE
jgi:hypothetical protein